jgi:hypothetical protein
MASDPQRLDQALAHLRRIKAGDYPVIMGSSAEGSGGYRIVERPWQDLPEPSKLAILQDAVDWSGITNRDQAHILLSEIDPGQITDAQRNRLIDMAAVNRPPWERLQAAGGDRLREPGDERGGHDVNDRGGRRR